tara:strand:+ start:37234 stop:38100 length:867 start_codon:yes stop_codon:yes gene_type:complete
MPTHLATYQKLIARAQVNWAEFQSVRQQRLSKTQFETIHEKTSENILEDLLTMVLDWEIEHIHYQIEYADVLLSHMGIKRAIVETKRPGALKWSASAIEKALQQARRYADSQQVKTIAICDGHMLYAADILHGNLVERLYVQLDAATFPEDLWWFSRHGIHRAREGYQPMLSQTTETTVDESELLHKKYQIPARCFAYAGDASDVKTWKLPYLKANGDVDTGRLSGAIRCITSNYRGANVKGIPHEAIPVVLKRLSDAAERVGKMPHQTAKPSVTYQQLAEVLVQVLN